MNREMVPELIDIASTAAALRNAETTRVGIEPLTSRYAGLTIDDAYAIQRVNLEHRIHLGERLVGRKIGLTSFTMQQQLGIDQPDYGAITDVMEIPNGSEFDPTELLMPRVEAEFAFEIGADLPVSPSYQDLVAAVRGVAVAIEVIDSRVADWRIALLDTVADNASMARVVWGDFVPATSKLLEQLPHITATLTRNDEVVSTGPGSAVLGHPLASLHWLATAIGAQGDSLHANDRVLAGAVAGAVNLAAGSTWAVRADGLPTATFTTTSLPTIETETGGTQE